MKKQSLSVGIVATVLVAIAILFGSNSAKSAPPPPTYTVEFGTDKPISGPARASYNLTLPQNLFAISAGYCNQSAGATRVDVIYYVWGKLPGGGSTFITYNTFQNVTCGIGNYTQSRTSNKYVGYVLRAEIYASGKLGDPNYYLGTGTAAVYAAGYMPAPVD